MIIGNTISGNAADTADASTPGTAGNQHLWRTAPIYGLMITGNTIEGEANGVVINAPGLMDVHLNNFMVGTNGVSSSGKAIINATMNYWGCTAGPGTTGCSAVKRIGSKFLVAAPGPLTSAPSVRKGSN